jgi:hypothetical protein
MASEVAFNEPVILTSDGLDKITIVSYDPIFQLLSLSLSFSFSFSRTHSHILAELILSLTP